MIAPMLIARPVADSVDELLAGARRNGTFVPDDARSPAGFERVEIDGERCVIKYVHPDSDFTMRVSGDVGCRPRRVWEAGLMDLAPDTIDHAVLGVARWGRNGWGAALLMRDVSDDLPALGDEPISEDLHAAFLDGIAALAAPMWDFQGDMGLLPHRLRWAWFGREQLAGEERLGFPEPVPRIASEGWQRFATRAPADLVEAVEALRGDTLPLSEAVRETPQTFVHGDWKIGNLGRAADGRVVLLDWAYPGEGPVCHELAWYLALNRARIPRGHTKESTIENFRAALERHEIATDGWWERQLMLCLAGALVQFGWEKALGDDDELAWWCDRAIEGLRCL